jgi:hypothetical protein
MSNPEEPPERFSLSRWSRRKHEVAREKAAPAEPAPPTSPSPPAVVPQVVEPVPAEAPLPPVDSLTIDSDFRAFLGPKVDEETKRAALKKLFSDPHFNVMDGLDIYIGDYTKSDPMPEGMLAKITDVYDKLTAERVKEEQAAEAAASAAAAEDAAPATVAEETPPPPTEAPGETREA